MSRKHMLVAGSVMIAVVVLVVAGGMFGAYFLALSALHNHANLSVVQACQHWGWMWSATAHDGTPALHEAVGRTLSQLGCRS